MSETILEFKCPKCGVTTVEEIQVNVTVATGIHKITQAEDGGVTLHYGAATNEGGEVVHFQCQGCGYIIVDKTSPHAIDGEVDEVALGLALNHLNSLKKGDVVYFEDLVRRLAADVYENMEGKELADVWNERFPDLPVIYDGDSVFWVKK